MEDLIGGNHGQGALGSGGAGVVIEDVTTADFVEKVVNASREVPVIVDFWAPWCEPCKQLTPALEQAVTAAAGKVRLAKINVDENQQLAQQLRIQSLPTVMAFHQGQPVDAFMGAQPESQIRAFIERLAGPVGAPPLEQLLEAAAAAREGADLGQAMQIYTHILQEAPGNAAAIGGLARCQIAAGDLDAAERTLALAAADQTDHVEIAGARSALRLARDAGEAGDLGALRKAVDANPDDHEARYNLAIALAVADEREAAVEALLEIIRRDRAWNDEAARKKLLELFEAYGPGDSVTMAGRRKLSSILFS